MFINKINFLAIGSIALSSIVSQASPSTLATRSGMAAFTRNLDSTLTAMIESERQGTGLLKAFDAALERGEDALKTDAYAKLLSLHAFDEKIHSNLVALRAQAIADSSDAGILALDLIETKLTAAAQSSDEAERSAANTLIEVLNEETAPEAGELHDLNVSVADLLKSEKAQLAYGPSSGSTGNIIGNEPTLKPGTWALTFDDGPHGIYSKKILGNLQNKGLRATFFELAQQVRLYPSISREIQDAGMEMANHSWSHAQLSKLGSDGLHREIVESTEYEASVWGKRPLFFRNPYGDNSSNGSASRRLEAQTGLIHVFWNVDTLDWKDKNATSVYNRAVRQVQARGKGVILFHDIHSQSVTASAMLMDWLIAHDMNVVTMSELLDELNGVQPQPKTPVLLRGKIGGALRP